MSSDTSVEIVNDAMCVSRPESHIQPNPDGCQRYIETEVAIGDPIELGGRGAARSSPSYV